MFILNYFNHLVLSNYFYLSYYVNPEKVLLRMFGNVDLVEISDLKWTVASELIKKGHFQVGVLFYFDLYNETNNTILYVDAIWVNDLLILSINF